jgi:hypothetical protein
MATCPVEMNLMPESTLRWQSFNQKKPYFMATVFSLVLVAFAMGFLFQKLAKNKQSEIERLTPKYEELNRKAERFNAANRKLNRSRSEAAQIAAMMQDRYYWGDFISEIRKSLMRAETTLQKKLSAQRSGVDVGIWVEQMISDPSLGVSGSVAGMAAMPGMQPGMPPEGRPGMQQEMNPALRAYMNAGNPAGDAPPPPAEMVDPNAPPTVAATNFVTLVCRAVNLTELDPSANSEMAYAVESEIRKSSMVDPKETQLTGQIMTDDMTGTFTFTVNVVPVNPIKD